jgi:hypothetical protein
MTLVTFVKEWYVIYDEISIFVIGGKWRRFGPENVTPQVFSRVL